MRGEHRSIARWVGTLRGSSPHARGTHHRAPYPLWRVWIIPACAGNTPFSQTNARGYTDHPRMRGEHAFAMTVACADSGSSPHARGTRRRMTVKHVLIHIIPACAGNTISAAVRTTWMRDHPRMRGEHSRMPGRRRIVRGSSPHARGTQRRHPSCV